ncbi:unnamed protein product, partial [Meganyctiphanes norvegica]
NNPEDAMDSITSKEKQAYDDGDSDDENVATLAGSDIKILLHNAIPISVIPILTRNKREARVQNGVDHRLHRASNPVVKLFRKRRGDPSRFNGRKVDVVWFPESRDSITEDDTPVMVQKGKIVTGANLQYMLGA